MGRVRIKICGITNQADACAAAEAGADAIGMIFHPPSNRAVTLEAVRGILEMLPPLVEPVAVVVNQSRQGILELIEALGPMRTIQWHGDELGSFEPIALQAILACPVRNQSDLDRIRACFESWKSWRPAAILIDARVDGQYGGTGNTAPWELLSGSLFQPTPLILAGGLTPENVSEAIRIVKPYGVDVAGGVETSPGRKDRWKMMQFIANVRESEWRDTPV